MPLPRRDRKSQSPHSAGSGRASRPGVRANKSRKGFAGAKEGGAGDGCHGSRLIREKCSARTASAYKLVIDVTLPATTRREAKLPEPLQILGEFEDRSYLGVPFVASYVAKRILTTGLGSLLDDPQHEYPLLKNGTAKAVRRGR